MRAWISALPVIPGSSACTAAMCRPRFVGRLLYRDDTSLLCMLDIAASPHPVAAMTQASTHVDIDSSCPLPYNQPINQAIELPVHPSDWAGAAPDVPVVFHIEVEPQAGLLGGKVIGKGGRKRQGGLPPGLESCCQGHICCACPGLDQQVLVGLHTGTLEELRQRGVRCLRSCS